MRSFELPPCGADLRHPADQGVLPGIKGKCPRDSAAPSSTRSSVPGETKLEINRRRVRERITRLNRELEQIRQQREDRRRLRNVRGIPVISIVGYTNAGKSTLLNSLTRSHVAVEDRLFETLDPSSRRLRFPRERDVIVTDTVGFIRDLPEDLMEAFAATLEELHDADLLLQVVDASPSLLLKTKVDKLTLLAAGPPPENPAELIGAERMSSLLAEVTNRYPERIVVIDAPPPALAAETSVLARQVDGILVVVRYGSTRRSDLSDLVARVGEKKILGSIVNYVETAALRYYGYKYGGYGRSSKK